MQNLFDIFSDGRLNQAELLGRLRARLTGNASLEADEADIVACLDAELAAGRLAREQVQHFINELHLHNPSQRPVRFEDFTFPEEWTLRRAQRHPPKPDRGRTTLREGTTPDDDRTRHRAAPVVPPRPAPSVQTGKRRAIGPGTTIDNKFVVEAELGKGGMGVVYRVLDLVAQKAEDPEPYIALKMLTDEFRKHPQSFVALQRETKKARELQHDNIVGVYSFAQDENKDAYMTMELLDGQTLRDVVDDHKGEGLPVEQATCIIDEMAAALGYSHKHNIVHADFKPQNVFYTSKESVKVLDFGLGNAVNEVLPNEVFDSADLGGLTLAYASVEMLQGERPVPADDVFALGLVAFELLGGRHPFDSETADKAQRDGRKVPEIPKLKRRQRRAIDKALAWNREDRHADAEEFLQDFRGPTPMRKSIYAGLATLVIVCMVLLYTNLLPEPPEIAYDELAPEARQQFDELINLGDTFAARNVYQSAYDSYLKAYLVSEREPIAVDRFESLFSKLAAPAGELPAPAAQNLWCKVDCLQQNFELFRNNWRIRSTRSMIEEGLAANQIRKPKCGSCPDYRKLAPVAAR